MARVLRLGRRGREFESRHPDKVNDVKTVPYQKKFGYSYAFGVFPTIELLENRSKDVIKVMLNSRGKSSSGVQKIQALCNKLQIKTEWAEGLITKIGGNVNTYAVGVFQKYAMKLEAGVNHLVLVSPEDTGNLGTILRTCLGFGIKNVVIIKPAVDIFDPKTVRASMGSVFKINFQYYDDFELYRQEHKNSFYCFMTNATEELSTVEFTKPYSLVFGSESAGLSQEFFTYGKAVFIKQTKDIDSLNLAVAVAVSLYKTFKE